MIQIGRTPLTEEQCSERDETANMHHETTPAGYLTGIEETIRALGRTAIERYPRARQPVLRGWYSYQLAYSQVVSSLDSLRYTAHTDISPQEVVAIDPARIEYLVEQSGYPSQTYGGGEFTDPKFKYAGTIRGGEWDSLDVRYEDTDLYRAFHAHFIHGVPWSDTAFYARVLEFIEDGIEMWGCTSESEFEQRCERIDALYESIQEHGYRSRREIARTAIEDPIENSGPAGGVYDEITVCIGRKGDILFFDGRNRLAIAKLLDLDSIPVWIMVRHQQWQERRERLAGSCSGTERSPAELREHPDMESIRP